MDVSYNQPYEEVKQANESFENGLLLAPESYKPFIINRRNLKKEIALHTLTFLLAIAVTTLICFLIRPFPPRTPQMKTLRCGSTSAEARALDCVYDVLSNSWVPTPCLDKKGLEEFKQLAQWQAYETREATRQLTEDEMGDVVPPNTYFTPVREHMVHCALMWRRLHRGYQEDQRYLDLHVRAFSHTMHCTGLMMEILEKPRTLMDEVVSQTTPMFSTCDVPA
ncbi:Nn.00g079780.m01.CDS01 [Neocucurbitaria sp. VM-36]